MRIWTMRLVGVLLVLALGVGIGAGPLQKSSERRNDELSAQKKQVAAREREIASLEAGAKYSTAYATATAPGLVRGALKGRSVTVVVLPGASQDSVDGVRDLIASAGGKATGTITFAPVMAKAASRQLVEALTSQMVTQNPDLDLPANAGGYQRFGVLLARAVGLSAVAEKDTAPYDEVSVGIISGLQTAGLLRATGVSTRAALTVVLTGPAADDRAAAGANAVPTTILRAYATRARVVVAGPASAAGDLGVIGALRQAGPVAGLSTVDTVETVSGQVTAVLALSALTRGTTGSWGGAGAPDGAIPPLG
jgi:hypothetical protein